jgi:hypothetical protein
MNFLTVVPFDLEKRMTIETNLASIAASLATIAEALKSRIPNDTRQAAAPVAVPAPVAAAPAPVATNPVFASPFAAPAPVATNPVFASPFAAPAAAAPVQAAPACPIADQASLVGYVMASYKEMGPVKGNQIQGVLAALGINNINEAKPEQYAAIFTSVEALKAQ